MPPTGFAAFVYLAMRIPCVHDLLPASINLVSTPACVQNAETQLSVQGKC